MTDIKAEPIPRGPLWTVAILIVIGATLYVWLLFGNWDHIDEFGNLGSAIGPIVGLINGVALLVAIWSVTMQRQELQDNREIMREQAKHAEELAKAQNRLAEAQEQANEHAATRRRRELQFRLMENEKESQLLPMEQTRTAGFHPSATEVQRGFEERAKSLINDRALLEGLLRADYDDQSEAKKKGELNG